MKAKSPDRPARPRSQNRTTASRANRHSPNAPAKFEPVDPAWIVKAFAGIVLLSVVCGYATLCVVYARSSWQLVLQPGHKLASTPASVGLAYQEVHFAPGTSGEPQLDGWWLPGDAAQPTALLLHGGSGDMSDALPLASALHQAGLSVLVFDYRGFGLSSGGHPTQHSMQEDADSALDYLTGLRSLPLRRIVPVGSGVGASLAARLCAQHPQLPAVILDQPTGDLAPQAAADPRSSLLPSWLLFHDDFPLAKPLATLAAPKLIVTTEESTGHAALHAAADPKMVVTLGLHSQYDLSHDVQRFLGSYLTH